MQGDTNQHGVFWSGPKQNQSYNLALYKSVAPSDFPQTLTHQYLLNLSAPCDHRSFVSWQLICGCADP